MHVILHLGIHQLSRQQLLTYKQFSSLCNFVTSAMETIDTLGTDNLPTRSSSLANQGFVPQTSGVSDLLVLVSASGPHHWPPHCSLPLIPLSFQFLSIVSPELPP